MAEIITLGGRDYPVAPLKFRDLKRILPLFLGLGIDTEAKLEAQGDIIAAAIATADPNFTRAAFDDLSPTIPELRNAISTVAILSGLERRSPLSGEAQAASPSPGATSTA
jgi:hypothetical protein